MQNRANLIIFALLCGLPIANTETASGFAVVPAVTAQKVRLDFMK